MSLYGVELSADVMAACLSHALSAEHQEVMGLLLGMYDDYRSVAQVTRCMALSRKDKKKDRVEVRQTYTTLRTSLSLFILCTGRI